MCWSSASFHVGPFRSSYVVPFALLKSLLKRRHFSEMIAAQVAIKQPSDYDRNSACHFSNRKQGLPFIWSRYAIITSCLKGASCQGVDQSAMSTNARFIIVNLMIL
jgi:hypothetical protein